MMLPELREPLWSRYSQIYNGFTIQVCFFLVGMSNFKAIIAINDISLTHFALTSLGQPIRSNRFFEQKDEKITYLGH